MGSLTGCLIKSHRACQGSVLATRGMGGSPMKRSATNTCTGCREQRKHTYTLWVTRGGVRGALRVCKSVPKGSGGRTDCNPSRAKTRMSVFRNKPTLRGTKGVFAHERASKKSAIFPKAGVLGKVKLYSHGVGARRERRWDILTLSPSRDSPSPTPRASQREAPAEPYGPAAIVVAQICLRSRVQNTLWLSVIAH